MKKALKAIIMAAMLFEVGGLVICVKDGFKEGVKEAKENNTKKKG